MVEAKQVLFTVLQRKSPRSSVAYWSSQTPCLLCLWREHHLCRSATFSALELRNLLGFFKTLMFWSNRNNPFWQAFLPKCADDSYTVKTERENCTVARGKLIKQTFLRGAKLNMSRTPQEPALLQLLLPKPQGSAGLGKTLNVYTGNPVIPRGCTPPGALDSQHHCFFCGGVRGCSHYTALPMEHHIFVSTGSYSF